MRDASPRRAWAPRISNSRPARARASRATGVWRCVSHQDDVRNERGEEHVSATRLEAQDIRNRGAIARRAASRAAPVARLRRRQDSVDEGPACRRWRGCDNWLLEFYYHTVVRAVRLDRAQHLRLHQTLGSVSFY